MTTRKEKDFDHEHDHGGGGGLEGMITPCFCCGSPLGHDGKGLPCPDRQKEHIIKAIHSSIKEEVNRAGAVYTPVLVPAATEVLLDLAYKESMFSLKWYGRDLDDVKELLRGYEREIREGLEDVWQQVLEHNDKNNNKKGKEQKA
jgi:hypothetical protein